MSDAYDEGLKMGREWQTWANMKSDKDAIDKAIANSGVSVVQENEDPEVATERVEQFTAGLKKGFWSNYSTRLSFLIGECKELEDDQV